MAITSLQDLLGTVPEADFLERLRGRELSLWRGTGPERLASLLAWDTLDALLSGDGFPVEGLRVTRGGDAVPGLFFLKDGRPDPVRIRQLLEHGASVVFSPLDGHVPSVDALIASIRSGTPDRVFSGAIVTTGPGGALKLHFDYEDLLIVQLEGTKRWRLHRTPVINAVRGMTKPAPPSDDDHDIIDETLHAGDLLLVPAGVWHHCENASQRSLHLGVFFVPPSLPRAAARLQMALLARADTRAPLTRGDGPASGIDEAAIKARLIDVISRMPAADLLGGDD